MNGEAEEEPPFVLKSMNAVEVQFCDAAFLGDVKTLSKLIAEGIDVNCRDNVGQTALHRASSSKFFCVDNFQKFAFEKN